MRKIWTMIVKKHKLKPVFQLVLIWVLFMGHLSPVKSQISSLPDEGPLPNIVLILADDMGYGDIQAFNHHSINGTFALRDGPWKMVFGNGSGGRQQPIGGPFKEPYSLFNLESDPTETTNVIDQYPDIAKEMTEKLKKQSINKK